MMFVPTTSIEPFVNDKPFGRGRYGIDAGRVRGHPGAFKTQTCPSCKREFAVRLKATKYNTCNSVCSRRWHRVSPGRKEYLASYMKAYMASYRARKASILKEVNVLMGEVDHGKKG
jgi:hypothetical protein